MMRAVLFAACAAASFASDDHSLMQQGVGIRQAESVAQLRSIVNLVGEEINQIDVGGLDRRMALDLLMKEVSEAERLTPQEIETINKVILLLEAIVAELKAEKVSAQQELDKVLLDVDACNDDLLWNNVTELAGKLNDGRDAHKGCRTDEAALRLSASGNCDALFQVLGEVNPSHCVPRDTHDPIQDHVNSWNQYFHLGKVHYAHYLSRYNDLKDDCVNSDGALGNKVEECNNLQNDFEAAFCTYRVEFLFQYDTLIWCYGNSTTDHDALVLLEVDAADKRTSAGKMLKHIICILKFLVNTSVENIDVSLCNNQDQSGAQADFNISLPEVPARKVVDSPDTVSVVPGTAEWAAQEYDDLDSPPGGANASCIV